MKFILLLVSFVVGINFVYSQDTSNQVYIRKVIWTTPVKRNTDINGLAIGFMAIPWKGADSLRIKGMNFEIAPFSFFGGMYAFMGTILSPFHFNKKDSTNDDGGDLGSNRIFTEQEKNIGTRIKGISVSLGGLLRQTEVSGFSINGVICFANKMNGVEVSGLMNLHYQFNGVMIAGLRNKVTDGKGLQIGLINTCKSGRIIQLGLINRIGNRIIPIINLSLKKR